MNLVLKKHLDYFVLAYLNNILIYSETLEEHYNYIIKVLGKLRNARLVVNLAKCDFYIQKVYFLGYIISPEQIKIKEDKVRLILKWPEPKNIKETQLFLELANYY